MDRNLKMGQRYNELRKQGVSSKEAAEAVRQQFGADVPDSSIRAYGTNYKKEFGGLALSSEHKEYTESKANTRPELAEPPEQTPPADLDERIRSVAREVFEEMLHNRQNDMNVIADLEDAPPTPTTITGKGQGRVENRDYEKVSITINKALWARFTAERNRLGISASRLMDTILWRIFNRPALAYKDREAKSKPGKK